MMKKDLRILWISLLFVSLFTVGSSAAFGQETTGSIEVNITDAAGAVVPNVPVSIVGTTTGFRRTVTTDSSGYLKVLQIPPGVYTLTAAATAGFVEKKIEQIAVGVGRTTTVPFELSTTVGAEVTVVAEDTTGLDVTDTKMQTTISAEVAELIPKGLNFSSILKFAPAARPESRTGQFQIDGASASENVFIIDGLEVSDVLTGALDRNSNLPFSLIQETQIKSSGFEAEFGGATGGVINVVTKSGGNDFHGEFGVTLRTSRLEPIPGAGIRFPDKVEYYPSRRSQYNETNPSAALLGPIWKNKVWFSVGYAPQIFNRDRELVYRDKTTLEPTGQVEHFYAKTRAEKVFAKLDAQPFSKLHLNSTFQWNPEINTGSIPGYTAELIAFPYNLTCQAGSTTLCGAAYTNQTGGRLNSLNFSAGGSYVINNDFVVSARIGHYFLNNRLGTYGLGVGLTPRVFCDSRVPLPTQPNFPAGFGCTGGGGNMVGASGSFEYDENIRDQIDIDGTYSFSLGGRHEVKAGFQNNETQNNISQENNDVINLKYGVWSPTNPPNTVSWLTAQTGVPLAPAPGAVGFGKLAYYAVKSDSLGKNKAIYIQDKWQPTKRLTLNLGLRAEREEVPAFYEGVAGIDFSWGAKLAPRLGAAYDLTGDGKTKISGFYGLFYDRFKLTMSRRTFGGEVYHFLYFDIFPGDTLATFNSRGSVTGGSNPIPGGSCPPNSTTPVYGRVRCDSDTSSGNFAGTPIDPDLKPFQQSELTFTFQRQLTKNYLFSARYSRKDALQVVEDVAFPDENPDGTIANTCCNNFITGNPGEGLVKDIADGYGFVMPKAQRQYDALELRLDRRFANNYFFSVNYTLSRLYGNYSGTGSSDEEGRLEPNIQRYFDSPGSGFTAQGGPDNGRLPTDRPHVLKAYGTYSLNWNRFGLWKNNSTDFQLFFTAQSGSVLTSFVQIDGVEQTVLYKRGDLGRTPLHTQTDLALRHTIKLGRDDRYTLKLETDVINLFNEYVVQSTGRSNLQPLTQAGNMISATNFTPISSPLQSNGMPNPNYAGLITQAQLDACSAAGDYRSCWATAYQNLQANGSPNILNAVATGGSAPRNPFYNVPMSYQGKRTIRYGVRFFF